jgi:uncharacterized membrane protein YtjA (UPF0391 family)
LVALGFNETQTVLLIYLIAACLGMGGINLIATEDLKIYFEFIQAFFIFIIVVILMIAGRRLARK